MDKLDPFDQIRDAVKYHEAKLADLWREAEATLERYHRLGDERARYEYYRVVQRQEDDMRRTIYHLRVQLPPFTTRNEDGIYERHPVTIENAHLLSQPV